MKHLDRNIKKAYVARAAHLAAVLELDDVARANDAELKKLADFAIKATTAALIYAPLLHHTRGLMQTATGYGSKLATPYKLRIGRRAYRVYSRCFSNVSSEYILFRGQDFFLNVYDYKSMEA